MVQKALTSHGSQCADCHCIVDRDDRFCGQCAGAFTASFQAVVCDACGSFAEASRLRCPSCRAELNHVENDEVEEEDRRIIPSLPLAAQISLEPAQGRRDHQVDEGPLPDLRISLQAAAAICFSAVQATLREDWIWKTQAPSRARQDELRKALVNASDTLRDVRSLLSSPAGMQSVLDSVKRNEIERLRDREAMLMHENEELRKAVATKELLMLISEDDLIARLGEDLRPGTSASEGMLEVRAVRRVLDAVGALLARLPAESVSGIGGTPEFAVYERLLRLYAARHASESDHSGGPASRDADPSRLQATPPFRHLPAI